MKHGRPHSRHLYFFLFFFICLGSTAFLHAQVIGDVDNNGVINIIDALMIAQYSVNLDPPGFLLAAADANSDTAVNIIDALIVAQYSVGLVASLPLGSSLPERLDNPFEGAVGAVPPDWSSRLKADGYNELTGYSTAFWLDTINSITYNGGLRGFLDAALDQKANLAMLVLYNMPNRDCISSTAPSELLLKEDGYLRYAAEFIDPIAAICSAPAYRDIRIVIILEPNSLANLVTSLDVLYCHPALKAGGYVECIRYALNRFSDIPNVYSYLTVTHAGWMGWDSNRGPMADLLAKVVAGTNAGMDGVCGFASNVAYYNPLEEPFLPDPGLRIDGKPLYSSNYYEWNKFFGELAFAQEMHRLLVARGLPASIGMIIDTSRNGWGGPGRPTEVSTSTDLNTYVDESRIDRRLHRGNWCNQAGGIGERPRANPAPHIDAYAWIKPPGFSDGVSHSLEGLDSISPNLNFTKMCDPEGKSIYNSAYGTGAMAAPIVGRFNPPQLKILMENAYPPF